MIICDCNETTCPKEKEGGNPRPEIQMRWFVEVLAELELINLGFQGDTFTWKGYEVCCRLDRAMATPEWLDLFCAARVLHLPPSWPCAFNAWCFRVSATNGGETLTSV